MKKYKLAWFRSLAGLSTNIAAVYLAIPLIGTTITFPDNIAKWFILILNPILGIVFLLAATWCERKGMR